MNEQIQHTYIGGCDANQTWVKEVKKVMNELSQIHRGFNTVVWSGTDGIEVIPLKFVQYQNGLILYKRDNISTKCYGMLIKLFAVFVDDYYHTNGNYYRFLNNLGKMQNIRGKSPTSFAFVADMLDTFYSVVMSGKFADRNKNVKINGSDLVDIVPDIQRGYDSFTTTPFLSIESACIYSVLKKFYGMDFKIRKPNYQSAKLILNRIEDIVAQAVISVGDSDTFRHAKRFFNIAMTYLDTSIADIQKKQK